MPRKANGCMTKSRKLEMQWYSPQDLANRADDGFRFVVRSAAGIVCNLPSSVGYGVSKVGRVLICRKRKTLKQQTEPAEAAPPPQDVSLKAAAGLPQREARRGRTAAAEPAPCTCRQATVEEPALREQTRQEEPPRPPLHVEALLKEHPPQSKVQTIVLRKALDDLLGGSERARHDALETLVGQGHVAGPLLVACSRESSSQVVETALEGLRRIDWPCLVTSISNVLESSDKELRIIALRAAGRLTDERKRPLLERGLQDPISRVRRRALSYLAWHDSSWAIAEIMRLCDDPEPDVKWAAVEALMTLRPSQAYDHLELMMPSLDPVHQRRAATLLAQRKDAADKRSKTHIPHDPEVPGPPAPKVPEEAEQTAPKKDGTVQSVDVQSPQGRKRKRRESKKPISDVKTGKEE